MQPTRIEIIKAIRLVVSRIRGGRTELIDESTLEMLADRIHNEGVAAEPPDAATFHHAPHPVTGHPVTSPSRAEIVHTLRTHADGTGYVPLDQIRELADRIAYVGISPEPCGGEKCPGCPECAVPVAELAKHGVPLGTAAHIQATRDASGIVVNAVIDRDYWEGASDFLSLDDLIGRLLPQPAGAEFKLTLPRPA